MVAAADGEPVGVTLNVELARMFCHSPHTYVAFLGYELSAHAHANERIAGTLFHTTDR